MKDLEIAKKILLKIMVDSHPFALALRVAFKKDNVEPQTRNNVTALLGCELRHHYLLDNLISRYVEEPDFEKTVYLRFLLANKLFLKRFNDKELYDLTLKDIQKEKVDNLLLFVESTNQIIPNDLEKDSPDFLAMRFNTPAWVIRMWQKQYGKGIVFKILKTNYHQSIPSVRVNTQYVTSEEILGKYPDFGPSTVKDVLVYQGRGSPKNYEEFKTRKLFFLKMGTKYIIDKLDLDPIKGIAIYSDVPNNIYLDLATRFGKDLPLEVITNHTQSYFEGKKICEEDGYHHINFYNASSSSVITCLSKKVDIFFCLPKSTMFDLLRSTPDYFLRLKQESLDEIIQGETNTLEECAERVELDGKLIYMVPTISKKESITLIGNFLFKHPEFKLVEEKQFFPFEAYDSCLYYAILEKIGEPSD